MIRSPLASQILFDIGPVPISEPVVVTWGLMAAIALGAWLTARSFRLRPGPAQVTLELIAEVLESQVRDIMRGPPKRYVPLLGTLFIFILVANWSSLLPGVEPPTAHIETDAALALIVFVAIIYFGIQQRGFLGYLRSFSEPNIFMVPLNLVETFTRTFSLMVRLFGNIMSGVFIVGLVLSLAGLLVPIPLMALDLLVGAVQAYIFTVLAAVFIANAVGSQAVDTNRKDQAHELD